jgi:hypothetical protein
LPPADFLHEAESLSDETKEGHQIEKFVGILTVETRLSISTIFACGWRRYNYVVQACFERIKVVVLTANIQEI